MRSFRQFLVYVALIAFAACSLIYIGCKNKCGSTTCQNGGTCASNICICPTGYSGNACQTGWSDAATGTYTCTRSHCNPKVTGVSSWQSVITKDATNGGYTIDVSNFDNSNITLVGTIDSLVGGSQEISLSSNTNGSGTNASGYMTIVNSVTTIDLIFTTYSGGIESSTCDMVMVKE